MKRKKWHSLFTKLFSKKPYVNPLQQQKNDAVARAEGVIPGEDL